MILERTKNNQITLTLPDSIDSFGVERVLNFVKYLELTSKNKVTQKDVDDLADELNSTWWENNKNRFIE